jgi:hypothetical protein
MMTSGIQRYPSTVNGASGAKRWRLVVWGVVVMKDKENSDLGKKIRAGELQSSPLLMSQFLRSDNLFLRFLPGHTPINISSLSCK